MLLTFLFFGLTDTFYFENDLARQLAVKTFFVLFCRDVGVFTKTTGSFFHEHCERRLRRCDSITRYRRPSVSACVHDVATTRDGGNPARPTRPRGPHVLIATPPGVFSHARRYKEPGMTDWSTIPVTPSGSTQVTINRLTPDTTYEFQVVGKNALGDGMLSKVITIRTLGECELRSQCTFIIFVITFTYENGCETRKTPKKKKKTPPKKKRV